MKQPLIDATINIYEDISNKNRSTLIDDNKLMTQPDD